MRELFRTSDETRRLVALFVEMSIDQTLSFEQAAQLAGFPVTSTLPAYHSARRMALRDHQIIIEGVRGIGFKRLDGSGMVKRGGRLLHAIKRRCRRGATEMEVALLQNLDRNDQLRASEQFNRFKLGGDIAASPTSNRQIVESPPLIVSAARPKLVGV